MVRALLVLSHVAMGMHQRRVVVLVLVVVSAVLELAEYAALMCSDRNSFMNGEVVIVDGGAIT